MLDLLIQFFRWLWKTLSGFLTWGWVLVGGVFTALASLGDKVKDFLDSIAPFIDQMLQVLDWTGSAGLQGSDPVGLLDFCCYAFGIDIFGRFSLTFLGLVVVCVGFLFVLTIAGVVMAVSQYLFKLILRVKGLFFAS